MEPLFDAHWQPTEAENTNEDVGIPYDRKTNVQPGRDDEGTASKQHVPYQNETRQRWMNQTHKLLEKKATPTKQLSAYAPRLPGQLTESDHMEAEDGSLHASHRDHNPRYSDQFILALQEGGSYVDDDDGNQKRGFGEVSRPRIEWATYLPYQYAYSPTLAYFRPPRSTSSMIEGVDEPIEREHPSPTGTTDSAGWLDRYGAQRLTPWVYVPPSGYSQTDVQFRTPRMDVLGTQTGSYQLVTPYTRYVEGGIPCVTNALSRDRKTSPDLPNASIPNTEQTGACIHDLSYGERSVEDAMLDGGDSADPESFRPFRSPWEQGVSLVHFKFGHARGHSPTARQTPVTTADNRYTTQPHIAVTTGTVDARFSTRLVQVAEQSAIKWMEDCGLSPSATLRNDIDPAYKGRDFNLVMRPPIEAFAYWPSEAGMWSTLMGWGRVNDDENLTSFDTDKEWKVQRYSEHFNTGIENRWVMRNFENLPPHDNNGAQAPSIPVDPGFDATVERLNEAAALTKEHWNTLYMRTRAYESRLLSSKRYYMHVPIELLSSSVTMSPTGYEKINASCLGCIYTGTPKFDTAANGAYYRWPNPMREMVTFLTSAETLAATGETTGDGFHRVAIVFTAEGSAASHESSVEHVIAQSTIRKAVHVRVGGVRDEEGVLNGTPETADISLNAGKHTPLRGDGDVRNRFANYVTGDPFNWLVSVAGANGRRGAFSLGVCDDDLITHVVALRTSSGTDVMYPEEYTPEESVRGAHDHLFPVPRTAWLRVALVQIYMYLTYPGLPPLLSDDSEGRPLDAQGVAIELRTPLTYASMNVPSLLPLHYARFGEVEGGIKGKPTAATFVMEIGLEDDSLTLRKDAPLFGSPRSVEETRGSAFVGRRWLDALVGPASANAVAREADRWTPQRARPVVASSSVASSSSSPPQTTEVAPTLGLQLHTVGDPEPTATVVSSETGRVVMTVAKRKKLFGILLDVVGNEDLCEADVLLADLIQKATGFMLSEYEQMCERLDSTRDDDTPLTSSDGAYSAWKANTDGVYGSTIRTRYPRGWRNPLMQWSSRRRRGFLKQPAIRRFLGAAMYGLSAEDVDAMPV